MENCTCSNSELCDPFIYPCSSCNQRHFFYLPRLRDFDKLNTKWSSRLDCFYRDQKGYWRFENYQKKVFLRTECNPPKWFFLPTATCQDYGLCSHYGSALESVYGRFLHQPQNDDNTRIFRGYVPRRDNNGTLVTYFSPTVYNSVHHAVGESSVICSDSSGYSSNQNSSSDEQRRAEIQQDLSHCTNQSGPALVDGNLPKEEPSENVNADEPSTESIQESQATENRMDGQDLNGAGNEPSTENGTKQKDADIEDRKSYSESSADVSNSDPGSADPVSKEYTTVSTQDVCHSVKLGSTDFHEYKEQFQLANCTCSNGKPLDPFVYTCSVCTGRHHFCLPRLSDFNGQNTESSSRLQRFYYGGKGYWIFHNYRKEVFVRTKCNPPKWFFQPSAPCQDYELCSHCGSAIENVYGRFLRQPDNEENKEIFHGYVSMPGGGGESITYFSLESYNSIHHTSGESSVVGSDCSGDSSMQYSTAELPQNDSVHDQFQQKLWQSANKSGPVVVGGNLSNGGTSGNVEADVKHIQTARNERSTGKGRQQEGSGNHETKPDSESGAEISNFDPSSCVSVEHTSNPGVRGQTRSRDQSTNSGSGSLDQPKERGNVFSAVNSLPVGPGSPHVTDRVEMCQEATEDIIMPKTNEVRFPLTANSAGGKDTAQLRDSNQRGNTEGQPTTSGSIRKTLKKMENCTCTNGVLSDPFKYNCCTCNENHSFCLPRLSDFDERNTECSSRLHYLYHDGKGNSKLRNFRQEEFLRIESNPPKWVFRPTATCQDYDFCEHYGSAFESVYGRFLRQPENEEEQRVFRGYTMPLNENGTFLIQFSPELYHEQLNAGESSSMNKNWTSQNELRSDEIRKESLHDSNRSLPSSEDLGSLPYGETPKKNVNPVEPFTDILQGRKSTESNGNKENFQSADNERSPQAGSETNKKIVDSLSKNSDKILHLDPEKTGAHKTLKADVLGSKDTRIRCSAPVTNSNFSFCDKDTEKEVTKSESGWGDALRNFVTGKNRKLFSKLQAKFKEMYETLPWKESYPIYKMLKKIDVFPFQLKTMVRDNGSVRAEKTRVFGNRSEKEILVFGLPGFGKTTLCQLMSLHWASSLPEMSDFKLCVYCVLPYFPYGSDFSWEIVSLCYRVLNDKETDIQTLQSVLNENSQKIILLLDGLDQLSDDEKHEVLHFVKNKPVFCESTIVVTSGQGNKPLLETFKKNVYIEGFSSHYITYFLKGMSVDQAFIDIFLLNMGDEKLVFLSELSPFFTAWVAKVVRASYNSLRKFDSIFSLLRIVVEEIIWKHYQESPPKEVLPILDLLPVLGKMCFRNLVLGETVFEQKELRDTFGSRLMLFENCRFLYKINPRNKASPWKISSKVLQVFFATMYLRNEWKICKEKDKFLKEVFCWNACTGDYVIEQPLGIYYVGLIPEIVLKCESDLLLNKASFQMYYDVSRVECSQAFDSVNLLLRVHDEYLKRFGFKPVESTYDKHFKVLSELLNSNSFDSFTVEHGFYENIYENRMFFKVELRDTETTESAFFGVLRETRSFLLDRLYLDFAFSKLSDLFPLLKILLSRYFKDINLYSNLIFQSFSEFVLNLVQIFVDCTSVRSVVVCCTGDAVNVNTGYNDVFTFHISSETVPSRTSSPADGGRLVRVAREKLCNSSNLETYEGSVFHNSYNERQYFLNKHIFQDFLNKMKKAFPDPRISLNIW